MRTTSSDPTARTAPLALDTQNRPADLQCIASRAPCALQQSRLEHRSCSAILADCSAPKERHHCTPPSCVHPPTATPIYIAAPPAIKDKAVLCAGRSSCRQQRLTCKRREREAGGRRGVHLQAFQAAAQRPGRVRQEEWTAPGTLAPS